MKQLTKAFQFTIQNPGLVMVAFIFLVFSYVYLKREGSLLFNTLFQLIPRVGNPMDMLKNPKELLDIFIPRVILIFTKGNLILFFLQFIVETIMIAGVYGTVCKGLDRGKTDLKEFFSSVRECWIKSIFYRFVILITDLTARAVGISFLFFSICIVIQVKSLPITLLTPLVVFTGALFSMMMVVISIFLSLWFPAVVADRGGVMEGLKNSLPVARNYFFHLLGVSWSLVLTATAANFIVILLFGFIPGIGSMMIQIIPSFGQVLIIVFYFILYREGKQRDLENAA